MGQHARGRLGPAGRRELVRLLLVVGVSEREAAASLSVAPATAHKWKVRYLAASEAERESGAWALDRSSRRTAHPAAAHPMSRLGCVKHANGLAGDPG